MLSAAPRTDRRILYRVQTVPGREGPLARISSSLPSAREAIIDHGAADPNPWRGYQLCLSDLGDATHVVVVQDDTIACRNFPQTVERVVEARPDTLTSLFIGGLPNWNTRQFMRALSTGKRWAPLRPINTGSVIHVVALIWPAPLAEHLLEWSRTASLPGHRGVPRSDDAVVSYWARMTKQEVWATVPCLIEHPDDLVPAAGHRKNANGADRGRIAASWIGLDVDPSTLDWSVA